MTVTQNNVMPSTDFVVAPTGVATTKHTVSVLHLINGEHYAGAERVQDILANRLGDYGFNCAFACLKPDRFQSRRESTVPLHNMPMSGRCDLRPVLSLARLLRRGGFQLLHTHTPRTALIGGLASRLTGVPMVHHFHGQTSSEMTRQLFGRFSAATERWSIRRASRFIAVSQSVRDHWMAQGVAADKLLVVPNGVPAPKLAARKGPGSGDPWTIGTVALFRPRKGTEILLEAVANLVKRQFPVRLRVIGPFESSQYEADVRNRAQQFEIDHKIQWVGHTTDVYGELACCDALVLPSLLAEGLPMVVLEGMACGVPIVATRVEGTIDVIQHEQNGLLADPGDANSLAAQLEKLIADRIDWRRMRDAAQADYRRQYSDFSMAKGVASVYEQVLQNSSTR